MKSQSFSFDVLFLNLADMMDMDGIFDEFETWPDGFIHLSLYMTLSSA